MITPTTNIQILPPQKFPLPLCRQYPPSTLRLQQAIVFHFPEQSDKWTHKECNFLHLASFTFEIYLCCVYQYFIPFIFPEWQLSEIIHVAYCICLLTILRFLCVVCINTSLLLLLSNIALYWPITIYSFTGW